MGTKEKHYYSESNAVPSPVPTATEVDVVDAPPSQPPSVRVDRPQTLALQLEPTDANENHNDGGSSALDDEIAELEEQMEKATVISGNAATPRRVNTKTRSSLTFDYDGNAEMPERKTPSHLTEQGHFDLKFYSHKLW